MRDDHRGTPAVQAAPKAEEAETREPRPRPRPGRTPGGPGGEVPPRYPDPTRYGDWEKDGRCIDF